MLVELAEYWYLLHRKVCNTWRDMIKTSTVLQYHIELAIAGMVNGPPGAVSTMERSKALHAHQSAWNANRVPYCLVYQPYALGLKHSLRCGSVGDALVYGSGEHVRVHRPASFFFNISEQSWHVNYEHYFVAKEHCITVAVDDAQDLIAMVGLGQGLEG